MTLRDLLVTTAAAPGIQEEPAIGVATTATRAATTAIGAAYRVLAASTEGRVDLTFDKRRVARRKPVAGMD